MLPPCTIPRSNSAAHSASNVIPGKRPAVEGRNLVPRCPEKAGEAMRSSRLPRIRGVAAFKLRKHLGLLRHGRRHGENSDDPADQLTTRETHRCTYLLRGR